MAEQIFFEQGEITSARRFLGIRLMFSASGEICAMVTKDKILAERVVAAINEAIVHQG
jgi:hypothetical protein